MKSQEQILKELKEKFPDIQIGYYNDLTCIKDSNIKLTEKEIELYYKLSGEPEKEYKEEVVQEKKKSDEPDNNTE